MQHKGSSRQFLLSISAALVGFLLGVAHQHSAARRAYNAVHTLGAPQKAAVATSCKVASTEYHSSDLEQAWLQNAAEWTKDYCKVITKPTQQTAVQTWVKTLARANSGAGSSKAMEFESTVFSRFVTKYTCGSTTETVTTWIEPLSHGLRHPNNFCGKFDNSKAIFDMSYLLLANKRDVLALRSADNLSCQQRSCQNIYMDLGATTWSKDEKEAGQGWFVRHYEKMGVTFDRLLLWEAKPVSPPSKVYDKLPQELMHKYQYYNIPATSDIRLPSHPLNMLKSVAQPGDFVVLKLDIDNSEVEQSILRAFLQDPEAFALVDEFFFEHHVDFKPMNKYWGKSIDRGLALSDSYNLFLQLRKKGWRAHSWV